MLIREHQTKTKNELVRYIMLKGTVIVTWENNMHQKLSLDENDELVRT